jgi:hypothetical protein
VHEVKLKLSLEIDMSEKELAASAVAKLADLGAAVEAILGLVDTLTTAIRTQSDVSPELVEIANTVDAQRAAIAEKLTAVAAQPGVLPPAGV